MTTNPSDRPRRPGTRTGLIPRVDAEPAGQQEPSQPPTLPEFESGQDLASVTGVWRYQAEGDDSARKDDDHPGEEEEPPQSED